MRAAFAILVVAALAAALAVSAASFPGLARADCGGTYAETAPPPSAGKLAPLAIGDSTLILSLPTLRREDISANAHECRQYWEGLALLEGLRRDGSLPTVVIVALGANDPPTDAEVSRALTILGPKRVLVMVTYLGYGRRPGPGTVLVRGEPAKHPGRVVVLDWVTYSMRHSAWFQPDGLHLTYPGAAAFAQFLGRAAHLTAAASGAQKTPGTGASRRSATSSGGPLRIAWILLGACDPRRRAPCRTQSTHYAKLAAPTPLDPRPARTDATPAGRGIDGSAGGHRTHQHVGGPRLGACTEPERQDVVRQRIRGVHLHAKRVGRAADEAV